MLQKYKNNKYKILQRNNKTSIKTYTKIHIDTKLTHI